jgi:type III secretion system (T3SS) SseB-like protein
VSTLLAALIACESGTAGAADVHAALLSGEVLVPLAEPPAGAATEFVAVETADGRAAVAAFSDERTLALWGDPPAHASVRAVELLRFVAAKGVSAVVLDPAGPVRATLQDGELAALAAGRVPSERDLTAVPAPLPETNIADVPAIRTAWLLEGARSGLRRSLLVVVEGDDEDALMAGLPSVAEAVAPAVGAVATLRFTIARPGARLDALRAETEPVYARA